MKKLLFFLLPLLVLESCSYFFGKKDDRILARVGDTFLYESDLHAVIPAGTLPKDSLLLARNYIDSWVHQKLILAQAQRNLREEQMDFSQQLEDYRISLIIYAYENELVKQKLDTVITGDEIGNYYDSNQQDFLLKENIVQIQYVKLALNSPNVKKIRKLLQSDNPADRNRLAEECEKSAADYFLDDQNWLLFNDLLKQIPVKTYNHEEFLKKNRNIEYQDSLYIYLVRFRDFKIKESVSPLSFEKTHIRDILLNKRKMDLINKMHEDVYQEALKNNGFEIF